MIRRTAKLIDALLMCAVIAAAPAFAQEGVGGTWELVVQAPTGDTPVTMKLSLDGNKATGTLASALGTMDVTGLAAADSVEVSGTLDFQGTNIPLTLRGKITDGAIGGVVQLGDFGDAPFTGKRPSPMADAAAATPPPAAAAPAPAIGVAGKWNVTVVLTGMGEFALVVDLQQAGEAVTGTLTSPFGTVPAKGTFIGTALKLDFTVDSPQGPIPVTMNGELTEQTLAGTATVEGVGEAEWKAVRGQ